MKNEKKKKGCQMDVFLLQMQTVVDFCGPAGIVSVPYTAAITAVEANAARAGCSSGERTSRVMVKSSRTVACINWKEGAGEPSPPGLVKVQAEQPGTSRFRPRF